MADLRARRLRRHIATLAADTRVLKELPITSTRCEECGAEYTEPDDSCQSRFDELLALDHSRQEPWGSRHGLAFAAFAVQHPTRFPAGSVTQSRELIERVVVAGEPLAQVVAEFRTRRVPKSVAPHWPAARAFSVTIADLGAFDAATYPDALLRWARAAISAPSPDADS